MDYYYNRDDYLSFGGESVKFCLEVCTFYLYNCTVFFPAYLVPNEISMYVLSQGILVSL